MKWNKAKIQQVESVLTENRRRLWIKGALSFHTIRRGGTSHGIRPHLPNSMKTRLLSTHLYVLTLSMSIKPREKNIGNTWFHKEEWNIYIEYSSILSSDYDVDNHIFFNNILIIFISYSNLISSLSTGKALWQWYIHRQNYSLQGMQIYIYMN